jgi:acetyl-CoA/propionyl-CoA carboxylase biotin carboxyl carrier protein
MATALPFHRLIVRDPAFTAEPFTVHTRWIETEWAGGVPPYGAPSTVDEPGPRQTIVVEVGGKRLEVSLPASMGTTASAPVVAKPAPRRGGGHKSAAGTGGDSLTSPMQGTIVKIAVADGDEVAQGDLVVVLEAMKMEQPINAHKAGVVGGLSAAVGDVIAAGSVICELK